MGPQRAPPWDSKKRMLWASSMVTSGLLQHSHSLMAPPEVWDAQSLPASLPHLPNQPITHSTHHGDEWGPQRAPPWDSKKRMLWASSMATSGLLRHSHSLMAPPEVWDAQSLPASLPHLPNQPITHSTHHGDEWGLKGPRLGTLKSGCCGPAAWRRAVFYGTLTVSWHHLRCGMPNPCQPAFPTYPISP